MWSKKRMPVAMRAFPRPSRSSFRRMSVSFVLRWIVAVRDILICLQRRFSGRRFPLLLNGMQQAAHFGARSDSDSNESRAHVLAAAAQKDALLLELSKERRARQSEIGEQEIAGARIRSQPECFQFCCQPVTLALHFIHVAAHGCTVADGGLGGHQGGEIDGEGWHGAPHK